MLLQHIQRCWEAFVAACRTSIALRRGNIQQPCQNAVSDHGLHDQRLRFMARGLNLSLLFVGAKPCCVAIVVFLQSMFRDPLRVASEAFSSRRMGWLELC